METETYDVVILGTGPAGLQAAIHAGRSKASVLVLGRIHKSGLYKAHVENFCCMDKMSGEDLLVRGMRQAEKSGAVILDEDVVSTAARENGYLVKTESERDIFARSLILSMGISRNKLGVPGEKKLLGKGVSYCVDCDANFYKGAKVVVIGDESAAVHGALTLLFYTDRVALVSKELNVSEKLAYQVENSDLNLYLGKKVKEIKGENAVTGIVLDDGTEIEAEGVFIELGAKGAVELAASLGVMLDTEKFQYIQTDKEQKTNIPGIYAAGDICGPPWQMAKAVGEGCVAGLAAAKYAKKMKG